MTDEKGGSDESADNKRPNLFQVAFSVLAAGFGVQSGKNMERDFKHGKASTFIIAGIVFTALFGFTLFAIVTTVLSNR